MVLVEDVTEDSPPRNGNPNQNQQQENQRTQVNIMDYVMRDKITALIFLTRLFTVVCTFFFIIPISGYDLNALYSKSLMSSAATSALKLHQRMTGVPFQLNRVYFANLMIEDSFHYLLYALIFMSNPPITIILMPVTGFAMLHVASYIKTLINLNGSETSLGPIRKFVNLVTSKDKDIMRFVAINEIMLLPTIAVMIFVGKSTIFMPFVYYRFLTMRYASRRNPYNKMMFYELRITAEHFINNPSCPQAVRSMCQRGIGILSRMAPV
jgi:hypothetical protein